MKILGNDIWERKHLFNHKPMKDMINFYEGMFCFNGLHTVFTGCRQTLGMAKNNVIQVDYYLFQNEMHEMHYIYKLNFLRQSIHF